MGTPRIRFRDPGECRIVKLNKNKIEELKAYVKALGKPVEFTDALQEGLKLIVYPNGKVRWRHRWTWKNGKKGFYTIGCGISIPADTARGIVRDRLSKIAQNVNPDEATEQEALTVSKFLDDDFIKYARGKYKNIKDTLSRCRVWIRPLLGDKRLDEISRVDVIRFHEKVRDEKSGVSANRCLSLFSAICSRAVDLELIEKNPCAGVKKFSEGDGRTRHLGEVELGSLVRVVKGRSDKGDLSAQATELALTTGKRKQEILGLAWSRVFTEQGYFLVPASEAKNKKFDRVELNSQALALLKRMESVRDKSNDWVFPSRTSKSGHLTDIKRAFKSMLAEAGITENTRFHDLRRTYATLLINSGASIYEVKEILSHCDIRSTQTYARLSKSKLADTSELAAKKIEEAMRNG